MVRLEKLISGLSISESGRISRTVYVYNRYRAVAGDSVSCHVQRLEAFFTGVFRYFFRSEFYV